jgi:hypothetical protein
MTALRNQAATRMGRRRFLLGRLKFLDVLGRQLRPVHLAAGFVEPRFQGALKTKTSCSSLGRG